MAGRIIGVEMTNYLEFGEFDLLLGGYSAGNWTIYCYLFCAEAVATCDEEFNHGEHVVRGGVHEDAICPLRELRAHRGFLLMRYKTTV